MASSREEGGPEANSTSESPGTPGTPGTPGRAEWIAEIMTTPHQGRFYDNIRMTKPCFYALVDALTSRGLLPHGQTSRVSSIEEVALFMQTVGMHKRQRDNMERFQHSLETINRRFHRVISALCALAPELITRPSFTETHARITNNPNFYPFFKDCIGAMDGTLVPAWVPRVDQNRYRSRKGGLAQNVLAICDFDMNFTYVYAGWEGSAVDARVLDHAVSHDNTFPFPPIDMAYRRYLETAGFPQDLHWTLNVEQRFMWMIVDDNTRAPMRDDAIAEAQMGHWARGLRRNFGYPYTSDQVREKFYELKRRFNQFNAITQLPGIFYDIETLVMVFPSELRPRASRYYPLASRYYQYPEPHYPSMLEVWGPIRLPGVPVEDQGAAEDNESINSLRSPLRGGVDAPIVISDSAAPSVQTHTHIASWDAVEHVARGDVAMVAHKCHTVLHSPHDAVSTWARK
ncbi:hypothetical protein Sango_1547600 [Sesamum angolense]|uniref:Uncharacterized protein n=1 Tax=Sesamum angolense TaxID=2727404 RepID=A0AAE1WPJ0_9LAMI|nr:hypothetical protein Sango_1547600 [Sesamum angolense]